MSESAIRVGVLSAAALIVLVTGVILTRSGRPFGSMLLNVHKLVDLAAVVALGVFIFRAARSAPLSAPEWTAIGLATALCVGTFATGGVTSARESVPPWVLWTHRVGSWIAVAATAWCALLVLT